MALEGDRQVWVLTDYGKERINEVIENPTEQIVISTVKFGDGYESPEEHGYYVPTGHETALKRQVGALQGYPVSSKALLKDDVEDVYNTVSFGAFIEEVVGGFQIYEIGLYESVYDELGELVELKLFALGTNEPINMPFVSDGYDINIDFELRLKSTNLASIYDQISLDPKNDFLRESDLDDLRCAILFVEGNLMEQISSNSHILGLNRAQQLKELTDKLRFTYSNVSCMNILSSVNNLVDDPEKIHGFWVFNQMPWMGSPANTKDFSIHANNMNLSKVVSQLEFEYDGVAPFLNFNSDLSVSNSYVVPANPLFHLQNESRTDDTPFTLITLFKPNNYNSNNTIFAQSNYNSRLHNFEWKKTSVNSIMFRLFTNEDNYITWETGVEVLPEYATVVSVSYNGNKLNPEVNISVDGLSLSTTKIITGNYTGLSNNNIMTSSYIINSLGNATDYVNSKLSMLIFIKDDLTANQLRSINQNLVALAGRNIYYGI